MKIANLVSKAAIVSGVILSAAIVSRPAMAASFTITIEDPGVMNANSSNLSNRYVQTFDGQATGFNENGFKWIDSNGQTIGQYSTVMIQDPDQYGAAGGNGKYFDVNTGRSGNANQTIATLKLANAQKYFGFWWSAGDSNNKLEFLSNGTSVYTMTTADLVNQINSLSNKEAYYGNPNSPFQDQNSGEAYAFINFYNTDGTFDEIRFTNIGATGFESDNHTVAANFTNTRAVPESSFVLGIGSIAFVGAASVMTRTKKKKTVFKLS
ncbi:hypothetical protein NIES4071_81920 [Calothrix sp. NIES-4071]|nr:hypothetical protein NIES4071_81920 [Calothrix sp. NIES-4071]BAZ62461.1 hypothetical protein NIES4105_81850 [Calothrix sp. NIES-4105]